MQIVTLGHSGRMCRIKQTDARQNQMPQQKRVSAIQSKTPWSSSEDKSGEEVQVFHINEEKGYPNKPFELKGKFQQKTLPRTH